MEKFGRRVFDEIHFAGDILRFYGEPPSSPRRLQPGGIYTSYIYGPYGQRTQNTLLDGRYERTHTHILGNSQWRWLEAELLKPAELRWIASGSGFLAEGCGIC